MGQHVEDMLGAFAGYKITEIKLGKWIGYYKPLRFVSMIELKCIIN